MKLRATRARSVKETKNTSQWLPEPDNTIHQWSRTLKYDPKQFPAELKNTKIDFVLDRILAFDSNGESCSLARVASAKCS